MRTLDQVINERDQKTRELKEAQRNRNTVEGEILQIQRKILELQLEKKKLEESVGKARAVVSELKLDIDMLKNEYWEIKG